MSFQKLGSTGSSGIVGRECVLIYQFQGKELQMLQRVLNLVGMREQIIVRPTMGDVFIKDLVEERERLEGEPAEINKDKALVFHGTSAKKLNTVLDTLKKVGIKRPLVAVVTDISKEWTFNYLLQELSKEREALRQNKEMKHD